MSRERCGQICRSGWRLAARLVVALPALGLAAAALGFGAWSAMARAPGAGIHTKVNAQRGFAIACDGNWAAVGARFDGPQGAGAVFMFFWNGSRWIVTARLDARDTRPGDQFGISVALHGSYLAVGAVGREQGQQQPAGEVHVFALTGQTWSEKGEPIVGNAGAGVRQLGRAVALDDQQVAISATVRGADGESGVILVHPLSAPNDQEARVLPADPQPGERFGESLALAGGRLIAGAPGHLGSGGQPAAGAAYVFTPAPGSGWLQGARLLQAADQAADAQFGSAVAESGTTAVVGAAGAPRAAGANSGLVGSGAVYVFTLGDGGWTQQQKLVPASAAPGDRFGHAVAIDGDLLIAGAPLHRASAPSGGAAYVFHRTGGAWAELPVPAPATLTSAYALFGLAVAQSGSRSAVGAPLACGRAGGAMIFPPAQVLFCEVAADAAARRQSPATASGRGVVEPLRWALAQVGDRGAPDRGSRWHR
ncbi:MAG TPA: FG-GAP repeat protein [Thermoanaerobaculia bacterium]|nr:FG-GAP repeat protein [Thermoanaerobaculia bacterium]